MECEGGTVRTPETEGRSDIMASIIIISWDGRLLLIFPVSKNTSSTSCPNHKFWQSALISLSSVMSDQSSIPIILFSSYLSIHSATYMSWTTSISYLVYTIVSQFLVWPPGFSFPGHSSNFFQNDLLKVQITIYHSVNPLLASGAFVLKFRLPTLDYRVVLNDISFLPFLQPAALFLNYNKFLIVVWINHSVYSHWTLHRFAFSPWNILPYLQPTPTGLHALDALANLCMLWISANNCTFPSSHPWLLQLGQVTLLWAPKRS